MSPGMGRLACYPRERFIEGPGADSPTLACRARCRQTRALGGNCFHVMPLAGLYCGPAMQQASAGGTTFSSNWIIHLSAVN